ncbi:MAG TPA: hypothetical protein VGQ83_26005 [Polyangia bacterium]|jgi:hypothetical protein
MRPRVVPVFTLWLLLVAAGCRSGIPTRDDADAALASADAAPATDGPADAAAATDGPADTTFATGDASNAACTFNADCPAAERCECSEALGCFCHLGARGTGVSGVDPCTDGNDCATSLCVEGNGAFYCSGPCTCAGACPAECGPQLPVCASIAFVGQICIRSP